MHTFVSRLLCMFIAHGWCVSAMTAAVTTIDHSGDQTDLDNYSMQDHS